MVHLLDVNVLLALAWPNHSNHQAAHAWFGRNHTKGWATCPMTQAGFVRLSSQPAVTKLLVPVREAVEILEASTQSPQQLTDAVLIDLAIRKEGAVATFDEHMSVLLQKGSPYASCLTFIPA
ncbi:MAG: TA system VapC family ribonuclease toxin [Bryobacteraceae bacterium]